MSEQVIENGNLKKASLIATIGSGILIATQIFGIITILVASRTLARETYEVAKASGSNFSQSFESYQSSFITALLIGTAISAAILILLLVFSLGFKKAKGRGKAITTTVISSILLILGLIGLVTSRGGSGIISIVNVAGYGLVLAGSIMAISAPTSEYEYNRLD